MVSDMGGRMRGALWGPGRYGRLLNLGNWVMVIFFFFSSRRRHTRWPRDWSSECALPIFIDRDQLLDDRARLLPAALVVAHDELDGRAAEPGEALARPERHLEVGVVVVDDVLGRLRRPQVLLPVVGEGAGERQHRADEHLGDLRLSRRRPRHAEGGQDEHCEGDEAKQVAWHGNLPTIDHEALDLLSGATSAGSGDGPTGSEKWKIAPCGSFGVVQSWPPCASTIERLIDNPMPMPPGLVVKKALNTSSRCFAAMPTPVSWTVSLTRSWSCISDRMVSSRGRPVTDAIAWMAFITRLRLTCTSCTWSPRTAGNSGASCNISETS